jgi:protein-disulfide isomerase
MTKDIFQLVEDDGNIRYVLKELPIFGEGSRFAAKAALAAARQDRYGEYHYALMTADQKIDEAAAMAIAAEIGLDMAQLKIDMLDPALDAELDQNFALANVLKVEGTPAMLIDRQFVPGARGRDDLAQFVEAARQAN